MIISQIFFVKRRTKKNYNFYVNKFSQFQMEELMDDDVFLIKTGELQKYGTYNQLDFDNIFSSNNNQFSNNISFLELFGNKRTRVHFFVKAFQLTQQLIQEDLQSYLAQTLDSKSLIKILQINMQLDSEACEFIPLEIMANLINLHMEFIQLMKCDNLGKFSPQEIGVFQSQSIQLILNYFSKNQTIYQDDMISNKNNIQKVIKKVHTLTKTCHYLRNQEQVAYVVRRINKIQKKNQLNKPFIDLNWNYYSDSVDFESFDDMKKITLYLVANEIDRLKSFFSLHLSKFNNEFSIDSLQMSDKEALKIIQTACQMNIKLGDLMCRKLAHIFPNQKIIHDVIAQEINQNILSNLVNPQFLDYYIQKNINDEKKLDEIFYWSTPHIQILLKYISIEYESCSRLQLFFTKSVKFIRSEQLLFYLPQIFQAMELSSGSIIFKFLIDYAKNSQLFTHQLFWKSRVESQIELHKGMKPSDITQNQLMVKAKAQLIPLRLIDQMSFEEQGYWKTVDSFFEEVTSISGVLQPKMPKIEKKKIIHGLLAKIKVSKDIYMPTNPRSKIIDIVITSGCPMQSAARVPILVTFNCEEFEGPDKYFEKKQNKLDVDEADVELSFDNTDERIGNSSQLIQNVNYNYNLESKIPNKNTFKLSLKQGLSKENNDNEEQKNVYPVSCIFKVFDDIRQDCLSIQIIRLFKEIFRKVGLELKLFPYKTISNRTGTNGDIGGIIECVQNSKSRDEIGKIHMCSLYDYFLAKYGQEDSYEFQKARQNFTRSLAAYSIVCYMLQIKDRHNGNILIDSQGHIVHIDFGFLFDISPGRNMKFESAEFKLTREYINIMGGHHNTEAFNYYVDLTIKGFLEIRHYQEHIYNVTRIMATTGLKCFRPKSLQNFQARFLAQKSDLAAAQHIKNIIMDAYDKTTTNLYDDIQYLQNKIEH